MANESLHTNAQVREELDAYGNHLPVYVESVSGMVYRIEDVRTADFGDGTCIVIGLGDTLL